MTDAAGVVGDVQAILDDEEEADAILRRVVGALAGRLAAPAGIRFVEEGRWTLGPTAGGELPDPPGAAVDVRWDGDVVAELLAGRALDDTERAAWTDVASRIADYCLVGWDTGGEDWEP